MEEINLQPEVDDSHFCRLSTDGRYSAKSAYRSMFEGATLFGPWERIWRTWAPPKCRFFLWLVMHKRCWTADRLARHGLPHHDHCSFCDQEEEQLITCCCPVFSPDNFGLFSFGKLGCKPSRLRAMITPLMLGGKGLMQQQRALSGKG
ncbi:hypothetical protein QOZ80_4AG0310820 [Eleusine coracana subsp. coracana]|nr:hypothetical protein QOZ80_4AG0310820 [Eleusine coracana subsp. coracana]